MSSAAQMRFCARRLRISPRRSSTAAAAEHLRRTGDPGFNGDISAWFYLRHSAAGFDTTLIGFREGTFPGRNMGGSKGAFVFEMLAQEIGRDRLSGALASILERHAHRTVTVEEFAATISRAAARDMTWFFRQWLERAGAPEWSLSWRQRGRSLEVVITQAPPYYRATLPIVAIEASRAAVVRRVAVDGARTVLEWNVSGRIERVELDPEYRFLRWTPNLRARALALAPVTRSMIRRSLEQARDAMREVAGPDIHGVAFAAHTGMAQLFLDAGQIDSARVHADAAVASASRDAEQLSLPYAILAVVAQRRGDTVLFRRSVANAITADSIANIPGASVWARGLRMPVPPTARP